MQITNSTKTATYASHVIKEAIVAVKLPNLGTGKGWKEKKGKLAGQNVIFQYNESRPTGVYFRFAKEAVAEGEVAPVNYVRERAILEEGALQIVVKEVKPKPEPKPKAEKPAKEKKAPKAKEAKAEDEGSPAPEPESAPEGDTGAA